MPRRLVASPFTAKVGARIRALRSAHDMSLAELANRTLLSKGHLSSVERGLVAITAETIERVASGFEVQPFYILTFPEEDERAAAAEWLRVLPQKEVRKVRRDIQGRAEALLKGGGRDTRDSSR